MDRRRYLSMFALFAVLAGFGVLAWWVFSPATPPPAPAVGAGSASLDELPEPTRRLFEADPDLFPALPEPEPDDWLSMHDEPGQTVEQYLDYGPNLPVAPRNVLYILPVGPMPAARGPTLDQLASYAHAFFGLEVRVLDPLDVEALEVGHRIHYERAQLNATDILDRMQPLLPEDAYCMIAVTWSDLYPDDSYNFVFGLARLTARVGVFSFARLHPDFFGDDSGLSEAAVHELVMRRALRVMSHEIGHMFGLFHCIHYSCNLNGSNSLTEADTQPLHLCPVCLRKLHLALGFDPAARYEDLEAEYEALGLERERAWVERRLVPVRAQ